MSGDGQVMKVGMRMPVSDEWYAKFVSERAYWDRVIRRDAARIGRSFDQLEKRIRHQAHCPPPCPDMGDYQRRRKARRRRNR